MKHTALNSLYEQANSDLQKSIAELQHPAEDVVNYSGCVFARKALYGFASCLYRYYAEQNDHPVSEHLALEELIEYAGKFDPEIRLDDFECVHCRDKDLSNDFDEVFYCDDVQQVTGCMELAEKMKALFLKKVDPDILQPS